MSTNSVYGIHATEDILGDSILVAIPNGIPRPKYGNYTKCGPYRFVNKPNMVNWDDCGQRSNEIESKSNEI